jgi:hypothetical protein
MDLRLGSDVPESNGEFYPTISRADTPVRQDRRSKRPTGMILPSFGLGDEYTETYTRDEPVLSAEDEERAIKEATGGFPDWIAAFIRRVILLFDNLPEESGGSTEGALRNDILRRTLKTDDR